MVAILQWTASALGNLYAIIIYAARWNGRKPMHCRYDCLVQERCNFIVNALELRLSCTDPSINEHQLILYNKSYEWTINYQVYYLFFYVSKCAVKSGLLQPQYWFLYLSQPWTDVKVGVCYCVIQG